MSSEIKFFTGVRGVAAILVFLHHNNYIPTHSKIFSFFYKLVTEFHVGVELFFCLSGFLFTYRYFQDSRIEKQWLLSYFRARFARIYPLYLGVLLLLGPIFTFIDAGTGFREWLASSWSIATQNVALLFSQMLLIHSYHPGYKFTGIAQAWSLTVEEAFYFLAPFIFYIIKRYKLMPRYVFLFYPVFFLGGIVHFLVLRHLQIVPFNWRGDYFSVEFYTFFGRSFSFLAGMYLAMHFVKGSRFIQVKRSFPVFTCLSLLGVFVCLLRVIYYERVYGNFFEWSGQLVMTILVPANFVLFFYGLLTEESLLKRILSSKLSHVMGRSSYAFYLIEMTPLSSSVSSRVGGNIFLKFWLMLGISYCLHRLVEEPLRRYFRTKRTSSPLDVETGVTSCRIEISTDRGLDRRSVMQ